MKQAVRKHADVYTNYRKALWKGTETFQNQLNSVVDGHAQFHTWTVPAIKEAQFIRKINMQLRAENKALKKKIEDLKVQLD